MAGSRWGSEWWDRERGAHYGGATDREGAVDRDEAFSKFQACAVEVLAVPQDKVVASASFADDLDADSLDLVELVMALEESFDIEVDETELEGISTVGEAFDLVTSKL
jgi:acyl carrier protein